MGITARKVPAGLDPAVMQRFLRIPGVPDNREKALPPIVKPQDTWQDIKRGWK
jgi:hypothetical protein